MQEHLFGRKIEKKKKKHTGTRKMCRIHSQKSELEVNPFTLNYSPIVGDNSNKSAKINQNLGFFFPL